jgi:WD40 repeat protein
MFTAIRIALAVIWGSIFLAKASVFGQEPIKFQGVRARAIAFSADGKWLAAGGMKMEQKGEKRDYVSRTNGLVLAWDLTTKKELFRFEDSERIVHCLSFSPTGNMLAAGLGRKEFPVVKVESGKKIETPIMALPVLIWELPRGSQRAAIDHGQDVRSLAWSWDGKSWASEKGRHVYLWDVGTGRGESVLEEAHQFIDAVALSPDGNYLAVASHSLKITPGKGYTGEDETRIKLWKIKTKRLHATFERPHKSLVRSLSFSPDSKMLASGSRDKTVKIFEVTKGEMRRGFEAHNGGVWAVIFSRDGKWLVTGGMEIQKAGETNGTVKIWNSTNQRLMKTFQAHRLPTLTVAICPQGRKLASGSLDGTVNVWDFPNQLIEGKR